MPLTTDEKLMTLSHNIIKDSTKPMEVFIRVSDRLMLKASC